ncbi:MAG: GGDEF domain-containing protein [Clostridia bacterium]|nr:GGDEF domain-containing protein [Clostridia bacterium]
MDLFADEQRVHSNAVSHIDDVRKGAPYSFEKFEALAHEYGRLLKHLRRVTKFSDRTTVDLHASNLDLIDKVHYDALTGIYNRRYMEENLRRIIKHLSRSAGLLSIMFLDIDFFKKYNDTYGHDAGDTCLKAIAETLSNCLPREDDFMARYGGEEFVIALPNTDEKGARVTADRLLAQVRELNILHEKNAVAGYVTVSLGGTTVTKVKHSHKIMDYIRCADNALYMSKHNGRNRYTHVTFGEDAK